MAGLMAGVLTAGAGPSVAQPVMALGFEELETAKGVFGNVVAAEGRHGQGVTGWQERFTPNPLSPAAGTLMMWAKLERRAPLSGFQLRLFTLDNVSLGISGGRSEIMHYGAWKVTYSKAGNVIETGDWHHWALTWEGTDRRLYIDGELAMSAEGAVMEALKPPHLLMRFHDYETAWAVDDFKIFDVALSAEQIVAERDIPVVADIVPGKAAAGTKNTIDGDRDVAATFMPHPVTFGAEQLVANPTMSPQYNSFPANFIPDGWRVAKGKEKVTTDANGLVAQCDGEGVVSVLAHLKRGLVIPGRAYQIGVYYKMPAGRALLRFRNDIDVGAQEFELAPSETWTRAFFFAVAPEDYDVGLYHLEAYIEGDVPEFCLRGMYCREATEEEIKTANIKLSPAAVRLPETVVPDESWIQGMSPHLRFMEDSKRGEAWSDSKPEWEIAVPIPTDGDSFWSAMPPSALSDILTRLIKYEPNAVPRLFVRLPDEYNLTPGRQGLDPLPARSTHAAALLFGIGAVDTGIGSFQFQRLHKILDEFGLFSSKTRFIPFWEYQGFYALRSQTLDAPVNYRTAFAADDDLDEAPLFGHTAPGVLVSGYLNGNKLLLVVVNTTDQRLGKFGHLWVDHVKLFGLRPNTPTGDWVNSGILTATDLETGQVAGTAWDRINSGRIADYWLNIAIDFGDYRVILIEKK